MNILNNISEFFINFWNNLVAKVSTITVIIAICFIIVGLSLTILADRSAGISRRKRNLPESDRTIVFLKVLGILLVFMAFLIFIFI